jgi:hypothetical protein
MYYVWSIDLYGSGTRAIKKLEWNYLKRGPGREWRE